MTQENEKNEQQNVVVPEFLKGMKGFDEAAFVKEATEAKKTETPSEPKNEQKEQTQTPELKNQGSAGSDEEAGTKGPVNQTGKKDEKIEVETKLFGKQTLGKNDKTGNEPVVLKEFSDIEKYVKSTYGVDDVNKFLTEVGPKWREQAQKAAEIEKKHNEVLNTLDKLDEDVIELMKANLEGKDWRQQITNAPKINFNKKVSDYSKEELINHYFPGKFSKEDFSDSDEENKSLDIAYEAAQKSFNNDKTLFEGKRAALIENENKRMAMFEKSITGSVEHLQKTLPHLNELVVKETGEILKSGTTGILSEFLNKDGTLKEDAAQKLALARHGLEALNTYMGIATRKAETETREEFVSKAADKLAGNSAGGENKISTKAQETLDMLKGVGKKTFY